MLLLFSVYRFCLWGSQERQFPTTTNTRRSWIQVLHHIVIKPLLYCWEVLNFWALGVLDLGSHRAYDLCHGSFKVDGKSSRLRENKLYNLGYWVIPSPAGSTSFWVFPIVWPSLWCRRHHPKLKFLRVVQTNLNQVQLCVCKWAHHRQLILGNQESSDKWDLLICAFI